MTPVQRTVTKEGVNKGRLFWVCPNSEKARCGFFEWDDDQGSSELVGGRNAASIGQGGVRTTQDCFKVRVRVAQERCFVTVESSSVVNQDTGVMARCVPLVSLPYLTSPVACPNGSTSGKKQRAVQSYLDTTAGGSQTTGECFKV